MTRRLAETLSGRGDKRRILALDGGGARGLLSLGVLARLERELGQRSGDPDKFRLADYFDLIGGTSTGAIIATTLALGWRVRDVVDLYFQLLPSIFEKPQANGFWRLTKPAYKSTALAEALTQHLGDRTLASDDLRTGLAIHCKRIDTGSAWVLVNNPGWSYYDMAPGGAGVGNSEFLLRDIVQASAAAPTYFMPIEVKLSARHGKRDAEVSATLVDGGVSPNNNPALQLLHTALDPAFGYNWSAGEDSLLLWSVGTGYVRKQFRKRDRKRKSSAAPLGKFRAYSSKVQAALEGYNHDISQQQIATLQMLSRPRFPWHINSEVRMQTRTPLLSGVPALTYQRYDARLEVDEPEFRRPEHIESLLGQEMKPKDLEPLRLLDISSRELLDVLYRTGEALGAAKLIHRDTADEGAPLTADAIAADWPPASFNPPAWSASPAAAPSPG